MRSDKDEVGDEAHTPTLLDMVHHCFCKSGLSMQQRGYGILTLLPDLPERNDLNL